MSEEKQPTINLDELQILRDQVATLSMKLSQAEQMSARHQAIANQLAQKLIEALTKKEGQKAE